MVSDLASETPTPQRPPRVITTRQFVWSSVLVTLGIILCIAPGDILAGFACIPLLMAGLVSMSAEERSRPLSGWQVALGIAGLVLFLALARVGQRIPDEWTRPIMRVFRHPLLWAALWLLVEWVLYRQWKRGRNQPLPGT